MVCLDCINRKENGITVQSVDFCSQPSCFASKILPRSSDMSHLATHLMLKTRDLLLLKDYSMTKQRAQYSLDHARGSYKDPPDGSDVPLSASPVTAMPKSSALTPNTLASALMNSMRADLTEGPSINNSPASHPTDQNETISHAHGPNPVQIPSRMAKKHTLQKLKCTVCCEPIATPCWYCIDCEGECMLQS